MSTVASALLRPDLLRATSVLVVGAASSEDGEGRAEPLTGAVAEACGQLGANVSIHARGGALDEAAVAAMEGAVCAAIVEGTEGVDMLVFDGAGLFASDGLHACLDVAWDATRAVVNLAFLPGGSSSSTRRIVYLAPAPGAGEHADAARAGLENLARTLSVEWARHEITLVTIALGDTTAPGEAAALTAYLASPAGAYFSGCLLDLRGP
jgi:NAD(P)-dependent dehydrogenase (short-subunit alcohol dehydrogenase family)